MSKQMRGDGGEGWPGASLLKRWNTRRTVGNRKVGDPIKKGQRYSDVGDMNSGERIGKMRAMGKRENNEARVK